MLSSAVLTRRSGGSMPVTLCQVLSRRLPQADAGSRFWRQVVGQGSSWPKADLRPVLRRDTAPGQGLFRKKGLSNLALAGGVAERLRHSWVITLRTRIRFS